MGDCGDPPGVLLGIDSGRQIVVGKGQRHLAGARSLAGQTGCLPDDREAADETHVRLIAELPRQLQSELQTLVPAAVAPAAGDSVPIDAREERDAAEQQRDEDGATEQCFLDRVLPSSPSRPAASCCIRSWRSTLTARTGNDRDAQPRQDPGDSGRRPAVSPYQEEEGRSDQQAQTSENTGCVDCLVSVPHRPGTGQEPGARCVSRAITPPAAAPGSAPRARGSGRSAGRESGRRRCSRRAPRARGSGEKRRSPRGLHRSSLCRTRTASGS